MEALYWWRWRRIERRVQNESLCERYVRRPARYALAPRARRPVTLLAVHKSLFGLHGRQPWRLARQYLTHFRCLPGNTTGVRYLRQNEFGVGYENQLFASYG